MPLISLHDPRFCLSCQVGVHVMAPAEVLAASPLPDAVAVMQLAVAASAHRAGGVQVRWRLSFPVHDFEGAGVAMFQMSCWSRLGTQTLLSLGAPCSFPRALAG
jgi:hypothetical protein